MLSSAATSSIAAKTLTPVSTSTGTRVELRCPQPLRQVEWHPPQKVGGRELRGVTGYCPQLLCDVLADVDPVGDQFVEDANLGEARSISPSWSGARCGS